MRKLLTIPAAVAGVVLFVSPAAADEGTSVSVASDKCGTATVTYTNSTAFEFFGDYQIGSEGGRADEVTGQTITEGPLAGQKWGNVFHPTPIAPGEQTVVPVEVPAGTPDKNGDGVITVRAWIDRGPEQHWFAPTVSVDVQLCEPTTPPRGGARRRRPGQPRRGARWRPGRQARGPGEAR